MNYKYITGFINEDFFKTVKQGLSEAAEQLHVRAEFIGTESDDCDALNALIYEAIGEKCDGIAVNFIHPTKLNPALKACGEAGIPVVAFNMDGDRELRLCAVSQQFYEAGKRLGDRLAGSVEEGASVLFTQHDPDIRALEDREAGIREALREKNLITYRVISGNNPKLACENIYRTLEEHPDIRWIFSTGQSDTHGAGLVSQAMPERKLKIGGFDVCNEILCMIRQGIIEATVDQQPYVQGFYPLLLLHQYRTRGITPFDIDTGSAIIDREKLALLS